MLHKLRSAMKPFLQRRLHGSVVVDVAYVGGIRKGVRGNEANQQFVVGIATEIVTPGDWRHVRLAHIHNDSSDNILRFVCEVVEQGCHVHTEKIANQHLRDWGYRHGGVKGDPAPSTNRYGPDFEAWWRSQFQVGDKLTKLQADAYLRVRGYRPPLRDGSNDAYSVQALLPWPRRVSSELEAWLSHTHRGAGAIAEAHLDAYLDELLLPDQLPPQEPPWHAFSKPVEVRNEYFTHSV
jgi:hypothetical protein